MDPGVAGIIGGAVGSVITGLVRALGIPTEIRRHDAAIRDRDDMLATWIADRDYLLKRECKTIRDALPHGSNADPPSSSERTPEQTFAVAAHLNYVTKAAEADRAIADARGQALHDYRDEVRRARLDVATILAAEGWPHMAWRKLGRRAVPPLTTPDTAQPLIDGWRKGSGMNPERWTYPDDATKRTLDDALESMPNTGP